MSARSLAGCLLLLATGLTSAQDLPEWTILVYLEGDCDLEHFSVGDVEEMTGARPSDEVQVVVQYDRAEADEPEGQYSGRAAPGLGDFDSTKRFVLEEGRVREIADLGETNMGAPETLAGFIGWGIETFPARRTALVLWDHGAGWPGYGGDDSHDGDSLTLPEIEQALDAGLGAEDAPKFAFIGFDCCLMATLEVMAACAPHAEFLIASEELEPGYGWDYTPWLSALAENPAAPIEQVAISICESYQQFFDENPDPDIQGEGGSITLAAVRLDRIAAVVSGVEAFAHEASGAIEEGGREAWLALAAVREDAEEYGAGGGDAGTAHLDLHHLATLLAAAGLDTSALRSAIEAAVVHHVAGADRPHARGISIFFPPEADALGGVAHEDEDEGKGGDGEGDGDYAQSSFSDGWTAFLRSYVLVEATDESAPAFSEVAASTDAIEAGEEATITATLQGDDVAQVYYVLAERADEQEILLGRIPLGDEAGDLEATFDGTWLALGNDEGEVTAPIESFEEVAEDVYLVGIPVLYQFPHGRGEPIRVTLQYRLDATGEETRSEFVNAFEYGDDGPTDVDIAEGGRIQPVYLFVDAEGETIESPADEEAFVVAEGEIELYEVELAAGKYLVGFVAEDYADNSTEGLVEIEVK